MKNTWGVDNKKEKTVNTKGKRAGSTDPCKSMPARNYKWINYKWIILNHYFKTLA